MDFLQADFLGSQGLLDFGVKQPLILSRFSLIKISTQSEEMYRDILERTAREILKLVIERIVQEELNQQKP